MPSVLTLDLNSAQVVFISRLKGRSAYLLNHDVQKV